MEHTVSHYRILEKIGEEGMGVVFSAEDTKLGRLVAIKMLPAKFSAREDLRIRLLREARTAASLNHPNICTIHEVGELDCDTVLPSGAHTMTCPAGTPYIVMELLRGQTLHALLARTGPLPLRDLLDIAVQIGEGLVEAHAHQIVHRDLKPQNVMVAPDGWVKILDFGLAKPLQAPRPDDEVMTQAATQSAEMTLHGHILGTVAYMSPEQAIGAPVDSRSDVFAFGTLLYELATAQRPFQGQTVTATLAKILEAEVPPASGIRAGLPSDLDRIIRRCLQKKPADRYNDTRDLLADLKELRQLMTSGIVPGAMPAKASSRPRWVAVGVGTMAALVAAGVLIVRSKTGDRRASAASFAQVTFVGDADLPAASPDGQFLAYVTGANGTQKVIVQDLTGGRTLEVFAGHGIGDVEWSPDGSSILVTTLKGLTVVPRLGGPPHVLPGFGYRVSWSPDGSQIAVTSPGEKQLFLHNVATGTSRSIALDPSVTFPYDVDWSPTGDWILLVVHDDANRSILWIVRPDGAGQRKLVEEESGVQARWAPTGGAIYYLKGTPTQDLWKLTVDRKSGEPVGSPVQLLSGLQSGSSFGVFHDSRRLVYLHSTRDSNLWLGTIDAAKNADIPAHELTKGTRLTLGPSFSPDGTRIVYSAGDGTASDIFVTPIDGGAPQQLTFMKSTNLGPVWSPDGRMIAFGSTEGGSAKVWQVPAAGGVPRPFANTSLSANTFGLAWAPGRDILYHRPGNRNFFILNPQTGTESPLLTNEAVGWTFAPSYSPDGQALVMFWNRSQAPGLYEMPIDRPAPREQHATRLSGPMTSGSVGQNVEAAPYRGKDVKLTAHVRTLVNDDNSGQCWLRMERPNGQRGFFDNMANRPIRTTAWSEHEIVGKVDADADRIAFGCLLKTVGQVWVDEIALSVRSDSGAWAPIAVKNPGFEDGDTGQAPSGWTEPVPGYTAQVVSESPYKGKRSLHLSAVQLAAGWFFPIGWSPDGKRIYAFDSASSDAGHIVTIPVEGGEAKPFLTLPVPEGRKVFQAAVAPDGRHVAFVVGESKSDVRIITNFDPSVR